MHNLIIIVAIIILIATPLLAQTPGPAPKIEFSRKIGGFEGSDANYEFYFPNDLVIDEENNLFVLDKGNKRVQKFSPDGNYLLTIGSEGEGPGEFLNPVNLALDKHGNLNISDGLRFHVFSTDGTLVETKTLQNPLTVFSLLYAGNIITRLLGKEGLLQMTDPRGNIMSSFGIPQVYDTMSKNISGNKIKFTHDKKDNIYVTFEHANRIEKYSSQGKLQFSINRQLPYEIVFEKRKNSLRKSGEIVSTGGWNAVSKGIAVDSGNRIWVATARRHELDNEKLVSVYNDLGQKIKMEGEYLQETDLFKLEIFNEKGILLGEIPLTHFCDLMKIYHNKLYVLDTNQSMALYEYVIKN